jgi:hypothetical protein
VVSGVEQCPGLLVNSEWFVNTIEPTGSLDGGE